MAALVGSERGGADYSFAVRLAMFVGPSGRRSVEYSLGVENILLDETYWGAGVCLTGVRLKYVQRLEQELYGSQSIADPLVQCRWRALYVEDW